jgi:hypothetical protein
VKDASLKADGKESTGIFLGLFFGPEDAGDMLLRNVS